MKSTILLAALAVAAPACAEPFQLVNNRMFIPVTVNGVAVEALLDSGAEGSILDPKLSVAAKLGEGEEVELKGSGGTQKARFVEGVTVVALGTTLNDREMVISELSDLSRRLAGRDVQMILGRDLFDAGRIRIDYRLGDVSMVGPDEQIAGTQLPLVEDHGVEAFPLTIAGHEVKVEFDTGNGNDPLISKALAAALELKPVGTKKGGGLGGELERQLVELPPFDLAGRHYEKIVAAVDEQSNAADLNFGTSILKDFLIVADFPGKALYLASGQASE